MNCKFNVPGKKRKQLAQTIASWLGCEASYKGAPSFAYEIDYFTIDSEGVLSFDDRADSEVIENLFDHLNNEGFEFEKESNEESNGIDRINIQIPSTDITQRTLDNLHKLIESKEKLIKKALGCDSLPVNFNDDDDAVEFPWFTGDKTPDEMQTYMLFISKLVEIAKRQKWVAAKQTDVENEKYAFRCFLLKLGFVGNEFKTARKILLRNFEGSSAFKSGKKSEVESNV